MDDIVVRVNDVDDLRQVLGAALVYFQAEDLKVAQKNFTTARPSPMTQEIERMKQKLDYYFSQHLFDLHEASLEQDEPEAEELDEDAEEDAETLVAEPLGKFERPQQVGRRLKVDELTAADE